MQYGWTRIFDLERAKSVRHSTIRHCAESPVTLRLKCLKFMALLALKHNLDVHLFKLTCEETIMATL